jgi:hypothetical protein
VRFLFLALYVIGGGYIYGILGWGWDDIGWYGYLVLGLVVAMLVGGRKEGG